MKLSINLKFCADCERLWENGFRCPYCGSIAFDYVSRFIPPMFWRGDNIDDTVKLTIRYDTIQKRQEVLQTSSTVQPISTDNGTADTPLNRELLRTPLEEKLYKGAHLGGIKEAEPKPTLSGLDHTGRVLGEAISRLLQIVNRVNANSPANMEAQMDKERPLKSREEPVGGDRHPQAVSEGKPKLRRSPEKI
jgi:hypothetical protein